MGIREYLKKEKILCDGAFGTWFMQQMNANMLRMNSSILRTGAPVLPEQANTLLPELVEQIHTEYLKAGAVLLRTNTFASNSKTLHCDADALKENIRAGFRNVLRAAQNCGRTPGENCFLAADIGPVPEAPAEDGEEILSEYRQICEAFQEEGADIFVFETFPDMERILPVIRELKTGRDIFVIVQFCVNQYGYSNAGISAGRLIREAAKREEIDAVGFNCGVGPGHLSAIIGKIGIPAGKYFTALPNAGYPQYVRNRVVFRENPEYFAEKLKEIAGMGADIVGGCCGTTPRDIKAAADRIEKRQPSEKKRIFVNGPVRKIPARDSSFFHAKKPGEKLIAVELSPPPGADDEKVMEAALYLKDRKVDAVTFPDSPSGRTRADSVLMGLKAGKETALCVIPHICCRDKNAIAMRSQLLGAYINGIRNALIVTGDPVPTLIRQEVKSVFNFDSVGLMRIIDELNQEEFADDPLVFGGALNYNRPNLQVEIDRMYKKMEQGASFFLTQPVFTEQDAEKLKAVKAQTKARILCGIMPLVSLKNALFIRNEMAGIHVTEEIVSCFDAHMTREEGEAAGVALARKVMGYTEDFADGYYFSIPFNRVYLLDKIIL